MSDRRVVVLGGGPAGHAAALAAARSGARVTLVCDDPPGGQCVQATCIPTASMLSGVLRFLDAQELAVAGAFELGDELRYSRLVARKQALVSKVSSGVAASLKMAGVDVVRGSAWLVGPLSVEVARTDGRGERLDADAIVIATGARWEAPPGQITLDAVHTLESLPKSACVYGGGPAATVFAVEYAFLLGAAGVATTFVPADGKRAVPALDRELDELVHNVLANVGVTIATAAAEAELVVAPDSRRLRVEGMGFDSVGLTTAAIAVDASARTSVPSVFAAGDVTGTIMLSSAAAHAGRVAGINAASAGGREPARTYLEVVPHVLHTAPELAWCGVTEDQARAAGNEVITALVDLSWSPYAITWGGHEGVLKLIADRELGQILGVHTVGPGAEEIVAAAAIAMSAELTVEDLAAAVHWHPSAAESLADAARQVVDA